jgi:hypothetical protein
MNSAGSIEFEFENHGANIKNFPFGSFIIISDPEYGTTSVIKPLEFEGSLFPLITNLNPTTKYTVAIVSPDMSTVTARGTFTAPVFSSSPAPLTN